MTVPFGEAQGVSSGEGLTAGWGEADVVAEGAGESIPNAQYGIGGGHELSLNSAVLKSLLHDQQVVDAITQRAQQICDAANQMVGLWPSTIQRLGGMPLYDVLVQNRPESARARARVKPTGFAGMLDDAHNSTLLKAMNVYPSDPVPEGIGPAEDTVQTPGDATGTQGEHDAATAMDEAP